MPAILGIHAEGRQTKNPQGAPIGDRYFELTISQSTLLTAANPIPFPADNKFTLYLGVELPKRTDRGRTILTVPVASCTPAQRTNTATTWTSNWRHQTQVCPSSSSSSPSTKKAAHGRCCHWETRSHTKCVDLSKIQHIHQEPWN